MQSKSQKAEISDASGAPVVSGLPFLELGIVNDGTDVPALDEAIIWGSDIYEVRVQGEQAGLLAEKIVRAVNSHDALVKALENVIAVADEDEAAGYGEMSEAGKRCYADTVALLSSLKGAQS